MEEEDTTTAVTVSIDMDLKKGGSVEYNGACTVVQAGFNLAADRGDRNGPGNRIGTGIRVLKAGHI